MSSSNTKERKSSGRKKRASDIHRTQSASRNNRTINANGSPHVPIQSSHLSNTNGEHEVTPVKALISDDELLKTQIAQKVISMVYNGETEDKLIDVISLDETTVAEVEMLREEVQNLKRMLKDATSMLQHAAKGEENSQPAPPYIADNQNMPIDWEQLLQKEIYRQKKRWQDENKREMDKLREYFEKQCSQSQTDYVSEIYALKLECQDAGQQRVELAKLRELCDGRNDLLHGLEDEQEAMMLEKNRHEQNAVQLHNTLLRMEKEKLASEERTKKILSAVRDGLHKLSDMKTDPPADDAPREPGLNTFYNHVEEIITSDEWSDDDLYVKGVMEEIQVSVQKLTRPSRTPDRVLTEQPIFASSPCQTDFVPSTPTAEIDIIKNGFETKISNLEDAAVREKQQYEQSCNDLQQQVDRLTQKCHADKQFIDELSSDREAEREEMLKLTRTLEESWLEGDKQKEMIAAVQQTMEDLENQLKSISIQNASLTTATTRLKEDLDAKNDVLRQREELVNELERQLSEKEQQDSNHQRQLEQLKMELSGILHSPPPSPEPSDNESSFMSFDDLRRQVMDLKDELAAKNTSQESEREKRVQSLSEELDQLRRSEQRAMRDCDSLQQQIEQQDTEIAMLRQQLDEAKFNFVDDTVIDQLNSKIVFMQKEIEGCHRVIGQMKSELHSSRTELETTRIVLTEKEAKLEQAGALISEDVIREKMEQFETRNHQLVQQIEETSAVWDQQQASWEADITQKTEDLLKLQKQLSDSREMSSEATQLKKDLAETKKRLEQTENIAQEKTVQVHSFRNLIDIMKSEALQKDAAVKAVQKQLNDNSARLAQQLEELERSNQSLCEEIDVYRNAPDRSIELYEPFLRDKDAEITRLRDLLEASLDESLSSTEQHESSAQTDFVDGRPASQSCFDASHAGVQTESDLEQVVPDHGKKLRNGLGLSDLNTLWTLDSFVTDGTSRDSGNNSKTPEPDSTPLTWTAPIIEISSSSESDLKSRPHVVELADAAIQADLENLTTLLAENASYRATVRELEYSVSQKAIQIETMAMELASLSDRHGKTQTKHRTTIRHLHQSGQSSSEEGSTNSLPRSSLNGETKGLIAKYERKIRELEKTHADEVQLLVNESLAVMQNRNGLDKSSREISPASGDSSMNGSTLLAEESLSDALKKALRELRHGGEAILQASTQLNGVPASEISKKLASEHTEETWTQERTLLLGKIDFFRDTINQLVLSRDSLEMALRHLEQQNEDMKAEVEMLKKEDQMADQGKDLLLSLLKKTESELAELHARYRQRDLRLEIEQAGREREEREREKLQKELRDTEVQLVRVRGELRQKDAQWEREKILSMWKKDSEEAEQNRPSWRGRYLRAESYRKNLIHQKRYLTTLLDEIIINTNDDYIKRLTVDGVRPTTTRRPPGLPNGERPRSSFRAIAAVVCAVHRLKTTRIKWQQLRAENS